MIIFNFSYLRKRKEGETMNEQEFASNKKKIKQNNRKIKKYLENLENILEL